MLEIDRTGGLVILTVMLASICFTSVNACIKSCLKYNNADISLCFGFIVIKKMTDPLLINMNSESNSELENGSENTQISR
jgi:uncharacterized protein YdeI (YjbR/CyaY-like superfamily)